MWRDPVIELVSVSDPAFEYLLETAKGIVYLGGSEAQADSFASARGHFEEIVGRGLGSELGRIYRLSAIRDDVSVKRVLNVRRSIGLAP